MVSADPASAGECEAKRSGARAVSGIALIALLSIGATPAEDAKQAYDKALKYSNAGEYEAALPHFRKAYELSNHRPSTILALAQCERELKLYEQAIGHFKEYLALKPPPKDSAKVKDTVALLEDLHSEQLARQEQEKKAAAEPPPPIEPPPPPPIEVAVAPPPPPPPAIVTETPAEREEESIWTSPVFWGVTAAVAVVVVATGVALGVALQPDADTYGGTAGVILRNK